MLEHEDIYHAAKLARLDEANRTANRVAQAKRMKALVDCAAVIQKGNAGMDWKDALAEARELMASEVA